MSIFQLHFQQIFSIMKKTAGGFLMFLDGLDELDQKIVQLLITTGAFTRPVALSMATKVLLTAVAG